MCFCSGYFMGFPLRCHKSYRRKKPLLVFLLFFPNFLRIFFLFRKCCLSQQSVHLARNMTIRCLKLKLLKSNLQRQEGLPQCPGHSPGLVITSLLTQSFFADLWRSSCPAAICSGELLCHGMSNICLLFTQDWPHFSVC